MSLTSSSSNIGHSIESLKRICAPSLITSAVEMLSEKCDECIESIKCGKHAESAASAAEAIDIISLLETVRLSMGQCDVRSELTDMMISISPTMVELVSIANNYEAGDA